MSILSGRAIRAALQAGTLKIDPAPIPEHYDSDSVDVHLSDRLYAWKQPGGGAVTTVPLWKPKKDPDGFVYTDFARNNLEQVTPDTNGIITMRPHNFYIADLQQFTTLPPNLAMHIQGKSALARLGVLVHLTAPHAHAGWSGRLTLEIYNLGLFNIELKPGVPIGQLTFWTVEQPMEEGEITEGMFTNQDKATGERVDK